MFIDGMAIQSGREQTRKPVFYEIADKAENEGRIILDQCVLCERRSNVNA